MPFDLPQGWTWCKISDVFSVERGGSPRPIKDYLTDSADGINWIKIADASASGKYITTVREKIRPQGLKKTRRVFVGDLLLTNSMSFGHPYILQVDGCIHDGWLVLHAFDSQLDKEFFYHLLSSRFVYVSFSITASGGVVQNLNAAKVSDTSIPLPPLAEQKRIVAYIEKLFRVADSLGEAADGLENAAKRLDKKILDLAIRGKLVPQDSNDEPASELVKRIAASHRSPCKNQGKPIDPPFEIPDSWEWVWLGVISCLISSKKNQILTKEIKQTGKWAVVSQGQNLVDGYSDSDEKVIQDVPIILFGDHTRNVKYLDFPFVVGADGTKLIQSFVDTKWLYYWVLYASSQIRDRGYARHWNELIHIPVPLPPLAEQKRIVAKIEELRAVIKPLTM